MYTWLKTCHELIRPMTMTKKVVGDSKGNVMYRKRGQAPAPSTIAAS